jgi:hypothetical protein
VYNEAAAMAIIVDPECRGQMGCPERLSKFQLAASGKASLAVA